MDFGVEHVVTINLVFHEIYKNRITKDTKFELYEGSKLIGIGHFTDE